ncbi:MAG: helix-hairpin-helix domain-containing protein [Ferruginibacter sp.]
MDNYQIAEYFSLLGKLSDIHGENSFKTKAYAAAAFAIEKLPTPLTEIPKTSIAGLKGIGASSAAKIIELLENGKIEALDQLIQNTPEGILEMMQIKGLGPKKITTIWKEMEIESIGELLYACKENRLKLYKGFGEKTQQQIAETIEFYFRSKGSFLYAQIHALAPEIKSFFEKLFPNTIIQFTGAYTRQSPVINTLDLVIPLSIDTIITQLKKVSEFSTIENDETTVQFIAGTGIKFCIHSCTSETRLKTVFQHNGCTAFVQYFEQCFTTIDYASLKDETEIFEAAGIAYIPPCRRENSSYIDFAKTNSLPPLIETDSIKAIIHSHSNWSDGSNSIEEMALAAKAKGLEYLVLSDHSQSAFYANGLKEDRIKAQHQLIDELNEQLFPFKIFKSIESDILNDGSLDYSDAILSTFDLVIASVHSNLKMTEEKAMMRLLNAIENPYTTILGHLTGRLLLSRKGYPINHEQIIEACAQHHVAIELNAHPSRLDIDWSFIDLALEKGVYISINPDAHELIGFEDVQYGVAAAQKTLLTPQRNLSSFSLVEFEQYLSNRKK